MTQYDLRGRSYMQYRRLSLLAWLFSMAWKMRVAPSTYLFLSGRQKSDTASLSTSFRRSARFLAKSAQNEARFSDFHLVTRIIFQANFQFKFQRVTFIQYWRSHGRSNLFAAWKINNRVCLLFSCQWLCDHRKSMLSMKTSWSSWKTKCCQKSFRNTSKSE